jgi:uncharacterized protein YuzE
MTTNTPFHVPMTAIRIGEDIFLENRKIAAIATTHSQVLPAEIKKRSALN